MSSEETLVEITRSLEQPKLATPQVLPQKDKAESAGDLTQSLLKLPEIAQTLKELVQEQKREADAVVVLRNLELEIQNISVSVESNLHQTSQVESRLKQRLDSLDLIEAKWTLVVERVNNVLDALERELNK